MFDTRICNILPRLNKAKISIKKLRKIINEMMICKDNNNLLFHVLHTAKLKTQTNNIQMFQRTNISEFNAALIKRLKASEVGGKKS